MAVTRDHVRRIVEPVLRRVRLVVSRAILSTDADDSVAAQRVDVDLLADETRDGVYRVQQYGLTSRPPAGAEAVCLACGGVREHLIAIAVDDTAHRPTSLDVGEVALWVRDRGLRVRCRADGQVDLGSEPEDFVALASLVKAELDGIKADLDLIKAHTHETPAGAASASTSLNVMSWSPGDVSALEVRAK